MKVDFYAIVGVMVIIALFVPLAALIMARIFMPFDPREAKNTTYECGVEPVGDAWIQFNIKYYVYALIFVIFDVETIFLYPWAVAFNQLGLFALIEMFIFLTVLFIGLAYAWRKGALEWT